MQCPICHRDTNSVVMCDWKDAFICQNHYRQCNYFGGTMLWACVYKKHKRKMKKIVFIDKNFEWMCVFAMRYALGRRSPSVAVVTEYITSKLPQLSTETLRSMMQDIAGHHLDEVLDAARWQDLYADIENEIDRRKNVNHETRKKNTGFTCRK